MKSKYALAGLLTLSVVALSFIAIVAAPDTGAAVIYTSGPTWQIMINGAFDINDVIEIEAAYYYEKDGDTHGRLYQTREIKSARIIILFFDSEAISAIPPSNSEDDVLHSKVTVKIDDAPDVVIIGGPAPAYGRGSR